MYEQAYITRNGYYHTAVIGLCHTWGDFCFSQALWISTKVDTITRKFLALKILQSIKLLCSKNSSSSVIVLNLSGTE